MLLSDIKIRSRHRKDLGDVSALAASIKEVGLLHPPVITADHHLIAGERRLAAARLLGWTEIPVTIAKSLTDALPLLIAERDENTQRKPLTPGEAVALADRLEPKLRAEAKERQRLSKGRGKRSPKFGEVKGKHEGEAERRVAAAVGLSATTLAKAREVVRAAADNPQEFGPLLEEMNRTGRVFGMHRKCRKKLTAARILKEPPPLPDGPFRVIVIDPPWDYGSPSNDLARRAPNPYPSMSLEQLAKMPISALAHEDAILWLWATNAFICEAHDLATRWGFEVKTILTWAKDRMGLGDWLRGQTEHCLMAARGKPTILLTNQTTLIHGKLRKHSQKPEEFYEMVEALCPGSKVELFSRKGREGWESHGAEL